MGVDQPLISVIVPVYKVEKYLKKCVDSLLGQTYGHLEIILVDDGSPDTCGAICDEYAAQNANVVALHKDNGGMGAARNYGVMHAKAEIIAFADSDDYVSVDYISHLWSLMEKYNADFVSCRPQLVDEAGRKLQNNKPFDPVVYENPRDAFFELYFGRKGFISAYSKLYKKEQLLAHPFPDGYYEDFRSIYKIVVECKRIVFADMSSDYAYVQREGSVLNSELISKHYKCFEICDEISDFIDRTYSELGDYRIYLYQSQVTQILNRQHMTKECYYAVFRRYRSQFRRSLPRAMKLLGISRKRKVYYILLCTTPQIYKSVWRIVKGKRILK